MLNVLIVEDDPMARKLLEIYIKNSENYNHVQSLESAALAEFCCRTNKINVILMDVCTAMDASGLDATEKIKKNFPSIKVIIMTSQPECSFIGIESLLQLRLIPNNIRYKKTFMESNLNMAIMFNIQGLTM